MQIASIEPQKAVPSGSGPASMYKLCVGIVASNFQPPSPLPFLLLFPCFPLPLLCPQRLSLFSLFLLVVLPPQVCYLSKPGKPPAPPDTLRRLGFRLQAVLSVSQPDKPHFAYSPRRGIADAQLRVISQESRTFAESNLHSLPSP